MMNKKLIMLAIFLVSLLTISAVNAEDNSTSNVAGVEENIIDIGTFDELSDIINNASEGNVIELEKSYSYDYNTDNTISIDKSLTINGNGHIINSNNLSEVFDIKSDNVILKNIRFMTGPASSKGTIYWQGSDGNIINCTFVKNKDSEQISVGKAIYCKWDDLTIDNCTFDYNSITLEGEGVISNSRFTNSSRITSDYGYIYNCTFIGNSGYEALSMYSGNVIDCYFTNYSGYNLINLEETFDAYIGNCIFDHNDVNYIVNIKSNYEGCYFTMSNSYFINNTVTNAINVIEPECDDLSVNVNINVKNCSFVNNTAGSLIYVSEVDRFQGMEFGDSYKYDVTVTSTITNCSFMKNNGNSINLFGNSIINNCTFSDNAGGPAIYIRTPLYGYSFKNDVIDCAFKRNSAKNNGGAISGDCSAVNCTFINNSAVYGGAMHSGSAENCIFINNTADEQGGAIYDCSTVNCTFINNSEYVNASTHLTVPDFVSTYKSGDKLIINLTCRGIAINDAQITIKVYDSDSILIGTYYCLSGDGWVVNLTPGRYSSLVSFDGDDVHKASQTTASITVNRIRTIISADPVTVKYGDPDGKIIATLTNAEGTPLSANIVINLNGVEHTLKTNSQGQANLSTANLPSGSYSAKISYKGNSKYAPSTTTAKVIVNTIDTVISAKDTTVKYGDANGKLTATLTNEYGVPLSMKITILLNGVHYYLKTNSKGQASVSTAELPVGEYKANIIYYGSNKYEPSTATVKVTVTNKSISVVSAGDIAVEYGDANGKFVAELTNDDGVPLSDNIVINLNGVDYALKTNSKGQASVSTADLVPGEYTATATYQGNSEYTPSSTTAKITVTKLASIVSADDVAVRYGDENGKFVATLTNAESTPLSANIVINLNGVDYSLKTNSKGQASVSTKDLKAGEYTATVTYKGNSKYAPSNTTAKVTVTDKLVSVVSADDVTVKYGDANGKFIATLTNAAGVPLSANIVINLNGKDYAMKTNSKGQGSVSTAKLAQGEYKATVTYKGNSKYTPSTTTAKVTVKLASVVSACDVTVKYGDANGKFIATLTNAEGTPLSANIVINLNGANYAMKTNSKGQASVSTAKLKVGEYKATVIYKGNSKYAPSTTTAKVIVTDKLISKVSAEDVTVNYGDANGKFIATLTNAAGVPLSANIVINLNGVNYAMKTNSKGQASVSTKDLEPGTYTATVTYKGNSKYAPSTTTAKVTVRAPTQITGTYNAKTKEVTGTLTNAEGTPLSANVVVSLNGVNYALKSNSKGQFKVSAADLAPGSYNAKLVYKGNSKYAPSSATVKVAILN